MKFHGLNDPHRQVVRYEAPSGFTTDTGEKIEGDLYRGQSGYTFKDSQGQLWWIMFSSQGPAKGTVSPRAGRIIACSQSEDMETFDVRVLASEVNEEKAAQAFRRFPPDSLEEAVTLAAKLREDDS